MRHLRWTLLIAALLISACGAPQPTQQAEAPTAAAPAATTQPTAAPTALPTATPAATATPEPTAQLILPPTEQPAETATPQFRAEPTAQPVAQPASKPSWTSGIAPTRLVIPDIKLDYKPVSVGLDKHRIPIVPDHDVGWYSLSSGPGQGENIVLWGHVLRFRSTPKTPAPFARLKDLKEGASVVLYDSDGSKHDYKITKQIWVTPDQVEFILPQGKEQVTMVSCIGDKVIQDGEVVDESHRLITVAEPA